MAIALDATSPAGVYNDSSSAASLTTGSFTPPAGSILVAKATMADAAAGNAVAGVTGFTSRVNHVVASSTPIAIYTSTGSGSPTTVTATFSGTGSARSLVVEVWTGAQLDATPAVHDTGPTSGAPTDTIVTTANNSVVTWVNGDWSAVAGARTYRSGATEDGYHTLGGQWTAHSAWQDAATSGSQTYGMTAPTGQTFTMGAIELQDSGAPARTVMPVSFGAVSSAWVAPASGATVTPTYPADDNLDLIVATLAIKPNTATVATPANWTTGPNDAVGGGTQGAGTGACDGFVFTRVSDGSLSGGSQAFTITGGSSPVGVMHAWKYDSTGFTDPQWSSIASTIYSRTTGSTTFGGTGAANLNLAAGDVLGVLSISADDQSTTHTISAVAATGCTFGTVTQSPAGTIVNAQGNDISAAFAYATVLTGPSSSAPSATISGNTSETGGVVFYRIRATGLVSATDYTVTPTDSAGSTDYAALTESDSREDASGSTDSSVVSVGRGVTVVDSAGATDTSSVSIGRGVVQVDAAGSVDSIVLAWGRGLAPVDSAGSTDFFGHDHGELVTDGAGSTDSLTLAWGRGVAVEDNTGSTDSATSTLTTSVTVTDTAGSTDSATFARGVGALDAAGSTDSATLTWSRALAPTDGTGSTDTAVVELARVLTAVATDDAGSTDSSSISVGRGVATTDSAGSADTATTTLTATQAQTDSAGSTDTTVVSIGRGVTAVDDAGSTDSTLVARGIGVAATDPAGSTDVAAVTQVDAVTDGAGSTDTAVVAPTKGVTATDPAGSTDQAALTRGIGALDSAGSTDYAAFTRGVAVEDSAGSTDSTTVDLVGAGFVIRTDDAGSADTFTLALARGLTFTDGAGSTDLAGVTQAKPFTDGAGSTDSAVVSVGRGVTTTDGAGSTDFTAKQQGVNATDGAGSSDSVSVALSGSGAVTATDSAGSSDNVARTAVYARPATDSAGSTDSAVVALAGSGVVTNVDSAGSTDSVVVSLAINLTATDLAGSTDTAVIVASGGLTVTDDAGSTDTWTRVAVYDLHLLDSSGVTDLATVTITGPPPSTLDYAHAEGTLSTAGANGALATSPAAGGELATATAQGTLLP